MLNIVNIRAGYRLQTLGLKYINSQLDFVGVVFMGFFIYFGGGAEFSSLSCS